MLKWVEFTCPALLLFCYWELPRPSHCIVRRIDAEFHTQQTVHCRNLRNKVLGCFTPVKSGYFGLRFNCVVRSWSCQCCAVVFTASVVLSSQNREKPGVVPYCSRICLLRFVLLGRTVVHSSRARADANCSPALPESEVAGIPQTTKTDQQEFLVPRPLPSKSIQNSTYQCLRSQRQEFVGFLDLPTNTPVVLRCSTMASSAPAHCRTPCQEFVYGVRPSALTWKRLRTRKW